MMRFPFLVKTVASLFCWVLLITAIALEPALAKGVAVADINPEISSRRVEKPVVHSKHFMLASANPLASQAGYAILRQGGSAVDAVIATQMVLNLTEPQSSGIGGGAFALHYEQKSDQLTTYDGRETAPAAARPGRFMQDGRLLSYKAAVNNGMAVGVPGVVRMLELAHQQHGRLPWHTLFQPAIEMAENGFAVSPRLHALIAGNAALAQQPAAAAYFFSPTGQPWPVGHILKNPAFAQVLREIAAQGADAFYQGAIARDMVRAVDEHPQPGDLTLADLAGYQAKVRAPVCAPYRVYRICGMPPPSSGGLGVLQLLGILEYFPMARLAPLSVEAVHYFSEAGRLAYADRDFYVADPDFEAIPIQALLDPVYLKARAALIQPDKSMGVAPPGDPLSRLSELGRDNAPQLPSTSHIVAVDAQGNVVSMTSSIEAAFGSKIFVRGFLLNNQLTDFSHNPIDKQGRLVANRVEGGKRPRSTMAPVIVFRDNKPYIALGSPGGSAIINYVAQALVGMLDWGLDIQQAISLPHYGSRNKATELEKDTPLEALAEPLRKMGHVVRLQEFPSGLQGIVMDKQGLSAGADPRREGLALGD